MPGLAGMSSARLDRPPCSAGPVARLVNSGHKVASPLPTHACNPLRAGGRGHRHNPPTTLDRHGPPFVKIRMSKHVSQTNAERTGQYLLTGVIDSGSPPQCPPLDLPAMLTPAPARRGVHRGSRHQGEGCLMIYTPGSCRQGKGCLIIHTPGSTPLKSP